MHKPNSKSKYNLISRILLLIYTSPKSKDRKSYLYTRPILGKIEYSNSYKSREVSLEDFMNRLTATKRSAIL